MMINGRLDTRPCSKWFVGSDTDGNLYNTHLTRWWEIPIRRNYFRLHREIRSIADFKASLRAGPFVWSGGYEVYFVCGDGGVLCMKCAAKEAYQIIYSLFWGIKDGWNVQYTSSTAECDEPLYCDHCSRNICGEWEEEGNA